MMREAPAVYRAGPVGISSDIQIDKAEIARLQALSLLALSHLFAATGGHFSRDEGKRYLRGTDSADSRAAGIVRAAASRGLALSAGPASAHRLRTSEPPFLLLDDNGAVHCVDARHGGQLITTAWRPEDGGPKAEQCTVDAALKTACVIVRRDVEAKPKSPSSRDVIVARLRPVLGQIALASVVINLLALATPLFMMTVYNKVLSHGAMHTLDVLALGMLTLFAFDGALRVLRNQVISRAGARIDAAVGADLITKLLRRPWRDLDRMTSGQLVEQLRQLDNIRLFFSGQVPILWIDLLFVGLFLAVLVALSPPLALITCLAIPPLIALSWWTGRRQRAQVAEGFKAAAARASAVGETLNNALTIKALGLEPDVARRFDRTLSASAEAGYATAQLQGMSQTGGLMLQHLVALVLVYVGAHQIIAGSLSVGALIACTILAARALAPLRQLAGAWQQVLAVKDALTALDAAAGDSAEGAAGAAAPALEGRLQLDGVGFRYADDGPMVLDGIDLDIRPGTALAVVGTPGSGKSTLAKLIAGLVDPTSGRLLADGFDLAHLEQRAYRRQLGYVPQEIQLFKGSIASNIAAGLDDQDINRIVAAAKFTGLHDVIERLPDGYETTLGDGRLQLSAGQRQLLAIARALVRNPKILILDEATSALDAATEERLARQFARVASGRTLILITHRPLFLAVADRALWLDGGKVKLVGSPQQVVEAMRQPKPQGAPA